VTGLNGAVGNASTMAGDALRLRNNFWVLRHGRSKANEAGIIVSMLENGVKEEYALADAGKEQARQAGQKWGEDLRREGGGALPSCSVVYCSPFSRTVETARLAAEAAGLDASTVTPDVRLRERSFGSRLELQSHTHYEECWERDQQDPTAIIPGDAPGESAQQVSDRLRELLQDLDARHEGANILLVSHGDCLQILQATVAGAPLSEHRKRFAIETGQLVRIA